MRKNLLLFLLLGIGFTACEQDQDADLAAGSAVEFQGKHALIRAEDINNFRFRNLTCSVTLDDKTPLGQIRVEASEDLAKWLEVYPGGGELRLAGKNGLPHSLNLHFYMHPHHIARIVVEGDNTVEISSMPVLDRLELITEGESELIIHDLKVRHLKSRREGKSRMFLSNELLDFRRNSISFLASQVQVVDNRFIRYKQDNLDYLLWAPLVQVRNDSIVALTANNNRRRAFFLTQSHEMVSQSESYLDALGLPTLTITSKNEGESEARVWPLLQLNVKGEGESLMYYFGLPQVNQNLQGGARLINRP